MQAAIMPSYEKIKKTISSMKSLFRCLIMNHLPHVRSISGHGFVLEDSLAKNMSKDESASVMKSLYIRHWTRKAQICDVAKNRERSSGACRGSSGSRRLER